MMEEFLASVFVAFLEVIMAAIFFSRFGSYLGGYRLWACAIGGAILLTYPIYQKLHYF